MWPERGEALSRTIDAEQAVADLYAEALLRWSPELKAAVLPTLVLVAAGGAEEKAPTDEQTLPPDPSGVQQASSGWTTAAEAVIVAGIALLWAATVIDAIRGLGAALPDLPSERGDRQEVAGIRGAAMDDKTVVEVVTKLAHVTEDDLAEAVDRIEHSATLRASRDEYLTTVRAEAAKTPGAVKLKIEKALAQPVSATSPADLTAKDRATVGAAIDPAGTVMRDVARNEGYQAAGVMNHAVLTAAVQAQADDTAHGVVEELQKTWICTLDGRTRDTHWAADGQRVALHSAFTVGGEQMQYPGDESASPSEWKNCRCRMGILAADEPLPDEVDRHTERLNGRDSVAIRRDGRTQKEEIERRAESGNVRARDTDDGIGRVASGAPSEQENTMPKPSDLTKATTTLAAEDDSSADDELFWTFTDALFAVTGVPTSDGRMLASDIEMTFRDTPMPLQWCEESEGGHYGSVTVGVIESISLNKSGEVRASGYMLNNENAVSAIDLIGHGANNPSVDLGDAEIIWTDENGTPVTDETYEEGMELILTVLKAEVLATTIVAIPAFGETRIRLNEQQETREKDLVAALVASMDVAHKAPVYDPALFADPKLTGPTRLTITEDGHVFGHVAAWTDNHRSVGLGNIKPPRSKTGYDHFHSSPGVHLSDGTVLPVGRLTVGIGHAPTRGVSAAAAQAHYDNVDACWSLGRIGEDRHGIWYSGVVAPWATPERVQMGLASPLSGDWRPIGPHGGNLELVAVLSVNTPGFLCKMATDSSGQPLAMVASLAPSPHTQAGGIEHLSLGDIKAAVAEGIAEAQRASELATKRDAALARARETVGEPPAPLSPTDQVGQLLAGRA